MCGVIGWVAPRGGIDEPRLVRALERLAHRGPDGRGTYFSRGGRVALGHTRLAVVDRATGAQPLTPRDGMVTVVVNGELYGEARLRAELESRGHVFATRSDSELLLHLYAERGLDCLPLLRGEFAFLIHDVRRGIVVAGRDRFGIKPLVWAETSEGVLLASEAKGLFALGVPARWDTTSFLHVASHQYLPPGRTMFAGVSALPPGHILEIDERTGLSRALSYWDIDAPRTTLPEDASRTDMLAPAGLREALDDAVSIRLRADRPVAFHLSGGLDSASIVALALRHLPYSPRAFAVDFGDPRYAEGAQAQETARALGVELELVPASDEALFDALGDAVEAGETLGINGQLPAKLLLSRAIRRRGFDVVLSGEGADEAFLGYPHLALDHARETGSVDDGAASASPLQRGVMLPEGETLPLAAVSRSLGYVPAFLEAKAGIGARFHRLLDDSAGEAMRRADPFEALLGGFDVTRRLEGRPRAVQSAYLWSKLALAGYILRSLGDGTEMASSVEGRTPFLDHHLFTRAVELPVAARLRDGIEKHALREAMRGVLPEPVRTRRKHPFLAGPLLESRSQRVREGVRDLLCPSRLARVPFVDPARVGRWLDLLAGSSGPGAQREEPVLQLLLSATHLAERFSLAPEVS